MPISKLNLALLVFLAIIIAGVAYLNKELISVSDYQKLKESRKETLTSLAKDEPIKIGIEWTFSLGNDYFKEGLELALEELNKKKVLGREIELIIKDNKGDSDISRTIALDFATDSKIVAVIGDDYADLAIPNSIIYEYAGVIMLSPAVSSPDFININFDYIFRNTPDNIDIGRQLAEIAGVSNFKRVAILSSYSPYSKNITKIFRKEILGVGSQIVYDAKFIDGSGNFNKILTDLSPLTSGELDYDAIFVAGDEFEVPNLIKEAREYGIYAPFLAGDFLDTNTILTKGEAMNGTMIATIFNSELLDDRTQKFINKFKLKYKQVPDTWAAQGYDALMLLASAIEQAKTLETDKIALALKYIKNYSSIFGTYSMDSSGNIKNRQVYIKRVNHGKFHYLYLK